MQAHNTSIERRGFNVKGSRDARNAQKVVVKEEEPEECINVKMEDVAKPIAAPNLVRLITSKTDWPAYTDIFLLSGRVNLTSQIHEVKLTVRKAIPKLLSLVVFEDAYPNHSVCEGWAHRVLLESAAELRSSAVRADTQERYHNIRQRLKGDVEYWKHLVKPVRCHAIPEKVSDVLFLDRSTYPHSPK